MRSRNETRRDGLTLDSLDARRPEMKGLTLNALTASALAIVVLVIVVAIGAQILGQIQTTQTVNSTEYNITGKGKDALKTYADWFSTIVVIIIAVVIIGLIIGAFAFTQRRGGGGGI